MKFKSQVYSQTSGSIGGVTYSRNRGGMYTRARAVPVNPGTTFQVAVRGNVTNLANLWVNTLSATQREGWDTYAKEVKLVDVLGEPRNPGGIAMYIRTNSARLQAGLTRIDDAPVIFDLGNFSGAGIASVNAAANTASITFTNTDTWATTTGGALLILASRGVNASINYFKGPYRFAGKVLGNSATPPTSPQTINLPFDVAAGQRVFMQFRGATSDGRLSPPFRSFGTAA